MRQINLGLDFFFAAQGAGRAGRRRLRFSRAADVGPYFFRFVLFQRAGMRFFLGDSDKRKRIKNGFTLHFQFPGEIVDSNLAHPPLFENLLPKALSAHSYLMALAAACRTGVFPDSIIP